MYEVWFKDVICVPLVLRYSISLCPLFSQFGSSFCRCYVIFFSEIREHVSIDYGVWILINGVVFDVHSLISALNVSKKKFQTEAEEVQMTDRAAWTAFENRLKKWKLAVVDHLKID